MSLLSLSKKRNAAVARAKSRTDPQKKAEDLAEAKSLNERIAKLKNVAGEDSSTVSQQPRRRFWQQEAPSTPVVGNNNANSSGNPPRSTASGTTLTPQKQAKINHELSVCNFSSNFPTTKIPVSTCESRVCIKTTMITRRNQPFNYFEMIGAPPPLTQALVLPVPYRSQMEISDDKLDKNWRDASRILKDLLQKCCNVLNNRITEISRTPWTATEKRRFEIYFGAKSAAQTLSDREKVKATLLSMRSYLNKLSLADFGYGGNEDAAAYVRGGVGPIWLTRAFPDASQIRKVSYILHEISHMKVAGDTDDVVFKTRKTKDGLYDGVTSRYNPRTNQHEKISNQETYVTKDGSDDGVYIDPVTGERKPEQYEYVRRVAYHGYGVKSLAKAQEFQIINNKRSIHNADSIALYITGGG